MLGVVVSRADDASTHIGEHLRDVVDFETTVDDTRPDGEGGGTVYRAEGIEVREFDGWHLHLDRPAEAFDDPSLVVFASRHSGETGPLLTAHHPGNFGPADHGGEDNAVARACPNAHARVLDALAEHAPAGYEVGMEVTHHGPTDVGAPAMFVEVGSGPEEWADPDAARAVALAICDLRGVAPDRPSADGSDETRRHLVGLGGGHYAPRFERVVRETDWAVGHIGADWGLDAMAEYDEETRRSTLDAAAATSRAAYALVDGERPEAALLRDLGYRVVSETWVRETDGVPLPFVQAVEAEVAAVDDGLRFGDPAAGYDGEFTTVSLPAELLEEVRGIDREATREALETHALAFGTDQGGTRVTGPAVLERAGDREPIVDGFLDVLRQRYDSVERREGIVVARKRRFEPERARTLGVPEGPKFGRLADGEPVEVGGETIPPEAVTAERERQFPLES
jgi:D-aminoacyl-tRNA deacylase